MNMSSPSCPMSASSSQKALKEGSDFVVFQRTKGGEDAVRKYGSELATSKAACLDDLLAASASADVKVLLLGEVHDDAVTHKLQLEVLQSCADICKQSGRRLVLSLEMFETDVQPVLDEYVLRRAIREADLLQDARPWGNYRSDYRPLVEFCKEHGVRVVAANAPRRYISHVSRKGCTSLRQLLSHAPSLEQQLPPLPLPPASEAYLQKFMDEIASEMPAAPSQQANANSGDGGCPYIGFSAQQVRQARPEMMEAQMLWDHSMALSIASSLRKEPGENQDPLIVHVCGAFHCAHGLGIPEALPMYVDGLKVASEGKDCDMDVLPWLPMDAITGPSSDQSSPTPVTVGPKECPPGVLSVVCWPGAVAETAQAARDGYPMPSLGFMGDWVVVTNETFESE